MSGSVEFNAGKDGLSAKASWQDAPATKRQQTWKDAPKVSRPAVEELTPRETARRKMAGSGVTDRLVNNFAFGLGDEASGVASVLSNAIVAPFSDRVDFEPGRAFERGRAEFNSDMDRAAKENPAAAKVADITGLAGAVMAPMSYINRVRGLGGAVRAGAKQGAISGAIAGAGYADGGIGNRAAAAGIGAATGGALGAALPISIHGIGNAVRGALRMAGRGPSVAPQIVGDALQADGGIARARGIVADANTRGVPVALGDTGDNARAIMASAGRQPGEARTIVRDMVTTRQEGQTDRIAGAIARDLGPVANPRKVSAQLIERAKTEAAPLYDKAYAAPMAETDALKALLARIPGSAVQNAKRIARLEGRDPNTLGVDIGDAGEIILTQKPSMQTLDYIKRGLDDVVEASRDKTTGKLQLDTEGRATNDLLRDFMDELDILNPAYKAARAAYAGPVRAAASLNKGSSFANKTADDIVAETEFMTPFELEQYRLGVRSAMTKALEARGDYADKIKGLVGTPKKRAALSQIFGGQGDFDRFIASLADEARTSQTFSRVTGGSLTAENKTFDAVTGDQGLIDIATNAAVTGGSGSPVKALIQVIADLRDYGAGKAGKVTRAQVAAALAETDPAILRDALRQASRARAGQRVAGQNAGRGAIRQGQGAGIVAGDYLNRIIAPAEQ